MKRKALSEVMRYLHTHKVKYLDEATETLAEINPFKVPRYRSIVQVNLSGDYVDIDLRESILKARLNGVLITTGFGTFDEGLNLAQAWYLLGRLGCGAKVLTGSTKR